MYSSIASVILTLKQALYELSTRNDSVVYNNMISYFDLISIVAFIPTVVIIERLGIKASSMISLAVTSVCLWTSFVESFPLNIAVCIINQITVFMYVFSFTAVPQTFIASKNQRLTALAIIMVFYFIGDNICNIVVST